MAKNFTLEESLEVMPYIVKGKENLQEQVEETLSRLSNKKLQEMLKELDCPYSNLDKKKLVKWLTYNLVKDYPTIASLMK